MRGNREGFSLVELIIAMVILSFAILAMGASTGYILTHLRASELRTERTAAVRQAAETIRGTPWADLENTCGASQYALGRFSVTCTVQRPGANLKRVQFISVGPAHRGSRLQMQVPDTVSISIAQPVGS
jgi:prepilin-type N-terminal cleavage/methylation domain-containing protein